MISGEAAAQATAGAPRRVVSKSEYAGLRGRHPAQVTRWIQARKLTPPALTSDGRIDVEEADRQLGVSLDLSQQLAQRAPILAPSAVPAPAPALPAETSDQARLLKAKADAAELEATAKRQKAEADNGRWIATEEGERAFAKQLGDVVGEVEQWLPNLAASIAAELGGDQKALTVLLRAEFRKLRAAMAAAARAREEALPEFAPAPFAEGEGEPEPKAA